MRRIHWPSFWAGFWDGASGGPLWRWLRRIVGTYPKLRGLGFGRRRAPEHAQTGEEPT